MIIVRQLDEESVWTPRSAARGCLAQVPVPYEHLEKLVLDKLRSDLISKLEEASYDDLKKLLFT